MGQGPEAVCQNQSAPEPLARIGWGRCRLLGHLTLVEKALLSLNPAKAKIWRNTARPGRCGAEAQKLALELCGWRCVSEVRSSISSLEHLSEHRKYCARVECALTYPLQRPGDLCLPPPMSKNLASTGLGRSPGARASALQTGLPPPKPGRRQKAGEVRGKLFPAPRGAGNQKAAKSALRLCKVVVESADWGGGTVWEKSGYSNNHLDGVGETLRLESLLQTETRVLGYAGSPSLNLDADG